MDQEHHKQILEQLVQDVCEQRISSRQALGIRRRVLRRMAVQDNARPAHRTRQLSSGESESSFEEATIQYATVSRVNLKKPELVAFKKNPELPQLARHSRIDSSHMSRASIISFQHLTDGSFDFIQNYYAAESGTDYRKHSPSSSTSSSEFTR